MKKILFLLITFFMGTTALAFNESDAMNFFYSYVKASNSYESNYFSYYASNAKIIRVVVKPDGTTQAVTIPMERYKKEANIGQKIGKIRNYTNLYSNITVVKQGNDYVVHAQRQPSTSNYKLPASFIIGPDSSGHLKIKEESMHTKVQRFLGK